MKIKFFAHYRNFTGCKEINIDNKSNIHQLLIYLSDSYGDKFRKKALSADGTSLGNDIIVLINGRDIRHLDGINSKLQNDDVISIFPVVAGG